MLQQLQDSRSWGFNNMPSVTRFTIKLRGLATVCITITHRGPNQNGTLLHRMLDKPIMRPFLFQSTYNLSRDVGLKKGCILILGLQMRSQGTDLPKITQEICARAVESST